MPKLTYTLSEAVEALAKLHNVSSEEIVLEEVPEHKVFYLGANPQGLSEFVQSFLDDKKLNSIKLLREMTGLGLKESKDLFDAAYMHYHGRRLY